MAQRTRQHGGWFEIEDRGFIRQQAGRDPGELVRELVQNAFDAGDAQEIRIDLVYEEKKAIVTIEDDGEGFRDPAEVYTIFLSGKADDPTKRGRKGRGLKEAIAVSNRATVELIGRTVIFDRDGHRASREERKSARDRGSRVHLEVPRWKAKEVEAVAAAIMTFEPPEGVRVVVNGEHLVPHARVETVPVRLQTIVVQDDTEQKMTRDTLVRLLRPRPGETPHLYEMGIPICSIDTPWHLDVQQRIPVPDHRSTVPISWVAKLNAQVLDAMAPRMTTSELTADWVGQVVGKTKRETQQAYVRKVYGSDVVIATPRSPVANTLAEEELGLQVIRTHHLPRGVREMLRQNVPSAHAAVRQAIETTRRNGQVGEPIDPTTDERRVCALTSWIARAVTARKISSAVEREVHTETGKPGAAVWMPATSMIAFSRQACPPSFFADPFHPSVLSVICHELGHVGQKSAGHGKEFQAALERVAGKVAHLLLTRGAEARQIVADVAPRR